MAREILFKAKRIDNGEWVEGFYFEHAGKHFIIDLSNTHIHATYLKEDIFNFDLRAFIVDQKTLCQYTGLTDKNGNKIWENDVVKGVSYSSERIGIIVWINELAGFGIRYRERNDPTIWENSSILKCATSGWKNQFAAEVIGNIFDNPELLKEE